MEPGSLQSTISKAVPEGTQPSVLRKIQRALAAVRRALSGCVRTASLEPCHANSTGPAGAPAEMSAIDSDVHNAEASCGRPTSLHPQHPSSTKQLRTVRLNHLTSAANSASATPNTESTGLQMARCVYTQEGVLQQSGSNSTLRYMWGERSSVSSVLLHEGSHTHGTRPAAGVRASCSSTAMKADMPSGCSMSGCTMMWTGRLSQVGAHHRDEAAAHMLWRAVGMRVGTSQDEPPSQPISDGDVLHSGQWYHKEIGRRTGSVDMAGLRHGMAAGTAAHGYIVCVHPCAPCDGPPPGPATCPDMTLGPGEECLRGGPHAAAGGGATGMVAEGLVYPQAARDEVQEAAGGQPPVDTHRSSSEDLMLTQPRTPPAGRRSAHEQPDTFVDTLAGCIMPLAAGLGSAHEPPDCLAPPSSSTRVMLHQWVAEMEVNLRPSVGNFLDDASGPSNSLPSFAAVSGHGGCVPSGQGLSSQLLPPSQLSQRHSRHSQPSPASLLSARGSQASQQLAFFLDDDDTI